MPTVFAEHIREARALTRDEVGPRGEPAVVGVSIPLFGKYAEEQVRIALREGIQTFVTSQGDPSRWTPFLKKYNRTVLHICTTPEEALKCEKAGVDAVIAEGTESGGHNGRHELTTMSLVPEVVEAVGSRMPVVASGGIVDGRSIAAALALGADGVHIDTRFAATHESSAHPNYKDAILRAHSTDTVMMLRSSTPVRALKNQFSHQIEHMIESGAHFPELRKFAGEGRTRLGIYLGDVVRGELDCGQDVALINEILSVEEVLRKLLQEYKAATRRITDDLEFPMVAEDESTPEYALQYSAQD
uniref:Nitronate monooxygenase domain-containing protein n=1 Tax=Pinguiococcus pyrenoidosus TaxID=172671 RepID=A0A7R9YEA0_9STRA